MIILFFNMALKHYKLFFTKILKSFFGKDHLILQVLGINLLYAWSSSAETCIFTQNTHSNAKASKHYQV